MIPAGGEGRPVRGPARTGHILCCICTSPIYFEQYRSARCWTDPDGTTCAAHASCLVNVGEHDLGLR